MVSDHSTFDSSPSPRGRPPSRSPSFHPDHHDSSSSTRRRHDDLAVEVCKDFIRSACVEAECKFSHPRSLALSLSMVPDGPHLDSPSPPRRKRWRSPSQSPSSGRDNHDSSSRKRWRHDELSVEVCKDFIRSACRRAETECKFAHPHSAVTVERDKVMACADSLRNKCFRGRTCRYFHPPPQIQESILKATGMEDPKVPVICQDFLRGRCERKSCRYSHILIHVAPLALQHYGASVVPTIPPQLGNGHGNIPLCRDFLKNACKRDSCKYAHPISHAKWHGTLVLKIPSSPPQPGMGTMLRSYLSAFIFLVIELCCS